MTMENAPFEDVCPIEMGISQCHVSFQGGNMFLFFQGRYSFGPLEFALDAFQDDQISILS